MDDTGGACIWYIHIKSVLLASRENISIFSHYNKGLWGLTFKPQTTQLPNTQILGFLGRLSTKFKSYYGVALEKEQHEAKVFPVASHLIRKSIFIIIAGLTREEPDAAAEPAP